MVAAFADPLYTRLPVGAAIVSVALLFGREHPSLAQVAVITAPSDEYVKS